VYPKEGHHTDVLLVDHQLLMVGPESLTPTHESPLPCTQFAP